MSHKYGNANLEAGNKDLAIHVNGAPVKAALIPVTVVAADGDGSSYVAFPNLSSDAVIYDLEVINPALGTGATVDLGFYEAGKSEVAIDDDALVAAEAVATAGSFDGMKGVSLGDKYKKVYELAGHDIDSRKEAYDLVLTFDDIGDTDGVVLVKALIADGY